MTECHGHVITILRLSFYVNTLKVYFYYHHFGADDYIVLKFQYMSLKMWFFVLKHIGKDTDSLPEGKESTVAS